MLFMYKKALSDDSGSSRIDRCYQQPPPSSLSFWKRDFSLSKFNHILSKRFPYPSVIVTSIVLPLYAVFRGTVRSVRCVVKGKYPSSNCCLLPILAPLWPPYPLSNPSLTNAGYYISHLTIPDVPVRWGGFKAFHVLPKVESRSIRSKKARHQRMNQNRITLYARTT